MPKLVTAKQVIDGTAVLPRDLSKLSKKTKREIIKTLSKLPLMELRKRQTMVEKQLALSTNELQVRNLQHMQKHLDSAVMLKEFGEY